MPNKRRPGMIFIGCQADRQLVADLDAVRRRKDRSQFIREAIAEKLLRESDIRINEDLIYPPPRGKKITYSQRRHRSRAAGTTEEEGSYK